MGSFSVVIPIYLGAIFVFFIYIVAKIVLKKLDDKEEVEDPVDADKESFKDDSWWDKITDRINKVGECVKEGKDLELEDEEEDEEAELKNKDEAADKKKDGSDQEFKVLKNRLDRTEQSLDNLGKTIMFVFYFRICFSSWPDGSAGWASHHPVTINNSGE